jgi:energy-converting hydrogenase A subunit M
METPSFDRMSIFKSHDKLIAQNSLKNDIVRDIQNAEGCDIDDIIYVLMQQLAFWQMTLLERLNSEVEG